MADETSPQLLRQELGARLRELRRAHGMTVEDVAGRLLCSPSKISRMETGQRGASQRDVRDLCEIYGVSVATTREELMALAKGARQRGVWHLGPGGGDPEYTGLEDTASRITVCVSSLVPALLQTEEYARAQLLGRDPETSEEWLEQRVRSFAVRQRLLSRRDPPHVVALIDEAALHRVVGGPDVMRAQIERLRRVADLPNVEVLIMPFAAGAHAGVESSFAHLEFDSRRVPAVVYTESIFGMEVRKRKDVLERYGKAIEYMRSVAPDSETTSRLLAGLRDSYAI